MGSIDTSDLWQQAAAKKRASCRASIPNDWLLKDEFLATYNLGPNSKTDVLSLDIPRASGLLSSSELSITENYSATALLSQLANGKLSSSEVVLAFSKRAVIAHQLVYIQPPHKISTDEFGLMSLAS